MEVVEAGYLAVAATLVVNVALVAYTFGSLRQIVLELKSVVAEVKGSVETIYPRVNRLEQRVEVLEARCQERHKDECFG